MRLFTVLTGTLWLTADKRLPYSSVLSAPYPALSVSGHEARFVSIVAALADLDPPRTTTTSSMPSPALAWFQDNRSETRSENPRRGATWMLEGVKEAELRKPPPTTSAFALGCERDR